MNKDQDESQANSEIAPAKIIDDLEKQKEEKPKLTNRKVRQRILPKIKKKGENGK